MAAAKIIIKWILRILAAIVIITLAVLIIFRIATSIRESKTVLDAAPVNGHFINTSLGQIYIQETGPSDGPAIVFIHGFGAWSQTWQPAMQAASVLGYHAIALDIPPFGFSEKPNANAFTRSDQAKRIKEVLDSLNIKSAVFVGHSVGGRATMEAVLENPKYVKALILVDPALGFDSSNKFTQNNPSLLIKTLFALRPVRNILISSTATNPLFTKTLFGTFVADKNILTKDILKIYQTPFVVKDSTNKLGDFLKIFVEGQDNSLSTDSANYKQVKVPTLLIWGEKDTVTPLWQSQNLNSLIAGSKLITLPGIGHVPQIENPQSFNETVTQFLKTLK